MDATNVSYLEGHKSAIQPYYMRGDVFQRDSRYYDQIIDTRKSRSGYKGYNDRSRSRSRSRGRYDESRFNRNRTEHIEDQQTRRLREENALLAAELQKLSYGGDFGTGDEVVKKQHYTASHQENQTIRNQEISIRQHQEIIKLNNEKLIKYQRASSELQIRMNNIQSIDKEIYRQLKGASMRDKQLLDRASSALVRGQPKQEVNRILQQIIIT